MSRRGVPHPMRQWVGEGDLSVREHFVYRIFGADGGLLYIGRTKHPRVRWAQHRKSGAAWVSLAASCRMVGPLDYPAAHRLERTMIVREQPPYNVRGLLGGFDARSAVGA